MNINGGVSSNCTNCSSHVTKWNISKIIAPEQFTESNYAILILNRPVTQNYEYILNLWNNASVRVTVDGGTRQWDKYLNNLSKELQQAAKIPDLVTGDFDSISEEVLQKYKAKGCKVVHTPDQNFTDFTKALIELNVYCQSKKLEIETVIVLGQTSGRIDQIMGNIQTLFLCKEMELFPSKTEVILMSDDSLSWLLYPGDNYINIPEDVKNHRKPWCSLVPIGGKCASVTTSGLKWDLDKNPLQFGDLISTSNTYNGSPIVKITCSHPILWSMKVPCLIGS